MTSSTTSAPVRSAPQDMPAAARRVLSLLQRLQHGTLHVQWPDGSVAQYGAAPATGPALNATLHLHSYAPLTQALKSGDIGFAESYIAGEWTTNNLSELLQLLVANRRDMDELIFGSWLGRLFYRIRHLLHRPLHRSLWRTGSPHDTSQAGFLAASDHRPMSHLL